jgi:hypothetical protein
LKKCKHTRRIGKNTSKGSKTGDFQNYPLNTNQWESEVKVVPKRDEKTSSWKSVEEYRIKKPNQLLRKKKSGEILKERLVWL